MKPWLRSAWSKVETFFFAPASPVPLAALRISVAVVLLAQAFLLRTSVLDFFSNDGLVQGELARNLVTPNVPRLSWFLPLFSQLHASEAGMVFGFCGAYAVGLVFLGLGAFSRTAAALCWFLHWVLMNTGETTSYGVDLYAHFCLFYLIWMPAGDALSIDAWRKGRIEASTAARLGLRVVQLHLCISYLCSGIEKATGPQWWNGELLWRALSLPEYRQFDMSWLASWPMVSRVAGISSLFLELGYVVFIWPRRTRKHWVLGIASMHLGIAIFLGLGLFGVIMSLLTLTVFGLAAEPKPSRQSGNKPFPGMAGAFMK